jgi:hypothetical protein
MVKIDLSQRLEGITVARHAHVYENEDAVSHISQQTLDIQVTEIGIRR